jgi:hypothetical protein
MYGNRIFAADGPIPDGSWVGAFAVKQHIGAGDPKIYRPVRFKDFTDGTTNTLLLSEALVPTVPGWGGAIGETIYGNMGGALFSAYSTPNSSIADRVTGPCPQDQGDLGYIAPCETASSGGFGGHGGARAFAAARSEHPGGVNAAMSDASVRFVVDDVSLRVWRAMGTRGYGDAASPE